MARVLAVLNRSSTAGSVLHTARLVANRLGEDDAWAILPRPHQDPDFMPTEEVMTSDRRDAFEQASDRTAREVREVVAAWQSSRDVSHGSRFAEIVGEPARTVALEARRASVIVIGHPLDDDDNDVKAAFHAALFESETSVVSTPIEMPSNLGSRPAIAWEPSAALERAIATAWPMLKNAEQVTLLRAHERPDGEDPAFASLLDRLGAEGVATVTEEIEPEPRHVGDAVLGAAVQLGTDLLIMGAYTHNPIREWLRAGATRELIQHARLPLLMHH